VDDDRDVPRSDLEVVLEPEAEVLELIEDAVRAGEIGVVVPRREAQ